MLNRKQFFLLLLALFIVTGCAGKAEDEFFASGEFDAGAPAEAPMAAESSAEGADLGAREFNASIANLQVQPDQDRLIIRDGRMNIVVEDTEATLNTLGRLAVAKGGWVVSSEVYESAGAKAGFLSMRIPAAEFDPTMAEVRALSMEVDSESTSSQDVTEEYVDLEARVNNLEATAERVRSFLDESRNVEEALAVNAELSRLEGEIESLKARMKFLSQSAAFSKLDIQITPDELSQPIEVGGWKPQGVALDAIEALITILQFIADQLIRVVIICLPLGLIFGLPLYFIGRAIYRRRQARNLARSEENLQADEDQPAAEPDEGTRED